MAVVVPVAGRRLAPEGIREFLTEKIAKHALPRYVEIASELPKTGTHRVRKQPLKERGVTAETWDAESSSSQGGG